MLAPLEETDPRRIGDYEILARLGSGGMATVYLGRPRAGVFAVKVPRLDDPVYAERFDFELQASGQVTGPFIARVVGLVPHASPPHLVSDLVPGPSLARAVRRYGTLSAESTRALVAALCVALRKMHHHGLVHADLKPSNILVLDDGPRLIDFGISGRLDETQTLRLSEPVFGSEGYTPPERLGPQPERPTVAGDMYALGGVAWFALTGVHPGLLGQLRLDGLPQPMARLVAACRELEPAARPTPADLLATLLPDGASLGAVRSLFRDDWLPAGASAEIRDIQREVRRLTGAPVAGLPARPTGATSDRTVALPAAGPAAGGRVEAPPAVPPQPPARRTKPGRSRVRMLATAAVAVTVLAAGVAGWALRDGSGGAAATTPPAGSQSTSPTGTPTRACARDDSPRTLELPFVCRLVWYRTQPRMTSIPVFAAPSPGQRVDTLQWGSQPLPAPQNFKCQTRGERYDFTGSNGLGPAWHSWWVFTQGDRNWWGFVPEVYLDGGDDDHKDVVLPECTPQDTAQAGTRS
ncbi:MAG TPA: serine/threonine-protein kinase [Micromonosporaceae bacterium]|nr:serine/threonine-protein kinase [Micromonosporaceae bacterium]